MERVSRSPLSRISLATLRGGTLALPSCDPIQKVSCIETSNEATLAQPPTAIVQSLDLLNRRSASHPILQELGEVRTTR